MRIVIIPLAIIITICACKKTGEIKNELVAKPNCTGNLWQADQVYRNHACLSISARTIFTYNNQIYELDMIDDRVITYDGANWDSISSPIPFNCNTITSFTIGNKGYAIVGTTHLLWEYNMDNNTWTQKADFPGTPGTYKNEASSATFTIGTKGYVVGGYHGSYSNSNETWEYSQSSNSWTQKADLPSGRGFAIGFSIGGKGYLANGSVFVNPSNKVYLNDLLQYDPTTDVWAYKAPLPGPGRACPSVFTIGVSAYIGGGYDSANFFKTFYKYNTSSGNWDQIPDAPVTTAQPSYRAYAFALNNKGYAVFPGSQPGVRYTVKYTPLTCIVPGL
jgi:hypothetical protein